MTASGTPTRDARGPRASRSCYASRSRLASLHQVRRRRAVARRRAARARAVARRCPYAFRTPHDACDGHAPPRAAIRRGRARSARGAFSLVPGMTPEQWRRYAEMIDLDSGRSPVRQIGYAPLPPATRTALAGAKPMPAGTLATAALSAPASNSPVVRFGASDAAPLTRALQTGDVALGVHPADDDTSRDARTFTLFLPVAARARRRTARPARNRRRRRAVRGVGFGASSVRSTRNAGSTCGSPPAAIGARSSASKRRPTRRRHRPT